MLERQNSSFPPLELLATAVALGAVSVSSLILVVAAAGYSTMHALVLSALLPAVGVLWLCLLVAAFLGWKRVYRDVLEGLWIGALATVGLEIVRIIGFRVFDSMPGSLPMLMGVLITNHFMQGPSLFSDLVGWAYHFWNGACFGVVYMLVFGRRSWWVGIIYGLIIAVIFMSSPVVVMTGAGRFGSNIGPGFATTVLLAHFVFGGTIGTLAGRKRIEPPLLFVDLIALGQWVFASNSGASLS